MLVPSDGIQRGINPSGPEPDRDACYLWTSNLTTYSPTPSFPDLSKYYDFQPHPTVTLGSDSPNEFIIIYGVNHVATGKATYSSSRFTAQMCGMVLGQSTMLFSMEQPRNISLTIPMRNTSMSTRLPGIAMTISLPCGSRRAWSLRHSSGSAAYDFLEDATWKNLQRPGRLIRRWCMIEP